MKQLQWKPKPQLFFICLYVIVALQEAGNNRDILSTFQGLKCRWDKWVKSRAKSYSSRTITEFVDRRQKCWGWSEHDKLCPESNSYSIVRDRNKNTSSPQSFWGEEKSAGEKGSGSILWMPAQGLWTVVGFSLSNKLQSSVSPAAWRVKESLEVMIVLVRLEFHPF